MRLPTPLLSTTVHSLGRAISPKCSLLQTLSALDICQHSAGV